MTKKQKTDRKLALVDGTQPEANNPNLQAVMAVRTALRATFQEREAIIDALLAAFIAGEHVVMLGPPGTGKSAIARALCGAVGGAEYFEWLLTRYTEPNELFGSIDLPKWSNGGDYERRMDGMLPTAHIAFLDEVFKANSSILNALLAILNERVFHDGGKSTRVPLRSVVAASNELPEGPELEALYDRFLVRLNVHYVQGQDSFKAILLGAEPTVAQLLTLADVDTIQAEARALPLGGDVVDALFELRAQLAAEGIVVSDRRWKKLLGLLRAHAYLCGDAAVEPIHFEILKHGLWRDPREQQRLNAVVNKTASPELAEATDLFDAIMEQVEGLPVTGPVKDAGSTVNQELKKAIAKLEQAQRAASMAVGSRIAPMVATLQARRDALVERITAELGL